MLIVVEKYISGSIRPCPHGNRFFSKNARLVCLGRQSDPVFSVAENTPFLKPGPRVDNIKTALLVSMFEHGNQ